MHQIGPACRAFIFKGLEKLVSAKLPPAVGHREQNYPFCSPGAGPWTQLKRLPSPARLAFSLVLCPTLTIGLEGDRRPQTFLGGL